MSHQNKPLLLICVTPVYGHVMPILSIAKELITQGYNVTMLTSTKYELEIETVGASFLPLSGRANSLHAPFGAELHKAAISKPPGPAMFAAQCDEYFVKMIPDQYESVQMALKTLDERHHGRPVILVSEGWFFGSIPGMLGAKGRRPAAWLSIGISALPLASIDHPPFGTGLLPDSSAEGRERNTTMIKSFYDKLYEPQNHFLSYLDKLGASKTEYFFLDASVRCPDIFIQMCIPSLEYPRSDAPDNIRFAGSVLINKPDTSTEHPSWWSDITTNSQKKRVVTVTQGTVRANYEELIIPTITALRGRNDVIVVALLACKNATLPLEFELPENTRVIDFMPYDDILAYSDVVVFNGGYGGLQHSVRHGVPLIVAGASEEKPEVAARAEFAGLGINMRTGTPTVEALRRAVEEILEDGKYRRRAMELAEEMSCYDPVVVIADSIEDLAAGNHVKRRF